MNDFRLVPLAIICAFTLSAGTAIPASTETPLSADDLTPDILQSYIYGFAPVTMEATRAIFTAVPDATSSPGRAPTNQFGNTGRLATPESRVVVRPNADTLYTTAWLDLSQQPIASSSSKDHAGASPRDFEISGHRKGSSEQTKEPLRSPKTTP
jgi:hypothetical protein